VRPSPNASLMDSIAREQDDFVLLNNSSVVEEVEAPQEPNPSCGEEPQPAEMKAEAPNEEAEFIEQITEQLEQIFGKQLPEALSEGSASVQELLQKMAVSMEDAKPVLDDLIAKANESVQNASIPPQVEQVAVTLKDTFEDVFQQASVAMGGFFSQLFPPAAPADPVSKRPFYEDDVRFQCSFVSDVTMLDGDCVEPSGTFTKSWMIMNSGTSAWPTGCYVAYVGGDNLVPTSAPKRVAVGGIPSRSRTVASMTLQAPSTPGTYTAYFRLCTPTHGGIPFGDRLWCTITVPGPVEDESASEEVEAFPHQESLDRLCEMGFDREFAEAALIAYGGDLEAVISSLVQ